MRLYEKCQRYGDMLAALRSPDMVAPTIKVRHVRLLYHKIFISFESKESGLVTFHRYNALPEKVI